MKKWIVIGGSTIVVVMVIVLVVGLSNLGPMIKKAVNIYGPQITKTEVKLGDVDIALFSAEAELKDFFLGNPKGFQSPQAMSVKSIYVNVDEKSLTGDTIIIDRIEVTAPEITYEKIRGTDNFQTLLKNVEKAVGTDTTATKPAEKTTDGEGKKILIKHFIVTDGKVNLAMPILGDQSLSANLPDIHLKDVGQKSGGASPAEVFKEVFASLYSKIKSPAVTDVFNKGIKELSAGAKTAADEAKKKLETATESVREEMEATTDKLKGLFGN